MTIEVLKQKCLNGIGKEAQLEKARMLAEDGPMENYHRGRKQVWVEVHQELVRWFPETSSKQLPVEPPRSRKGIHEVG
jgi:hypothetical protein